MLLLAEPEAEAVPIDDQFTPSFEALIVTVPVGVPVQTVWTETLLAKPTFSDPEYVLVPDTACPLIIATLCTTATDYSHDNKLLKFVIFLEKNREMFLIV